MKKMLMLASVASMIDQFNMPNIQILQQQGYEVHVACNFQKGSTCSMEKIAELKKRLEKMDVKYFQIDFSRNVLKLNEVKKAYDQVKSLCKKEKYQFIHCHSPIGGVIGRLAGHATKTKVMYTAHGFHFYKGAPIVNWLIYYPIERWLARYTDMLITINKEDYERAKGFKAKRVERIPGVGVDLERFQKSKSRRDDMRRKLGVEKEQIMLLSVGELNKNKNHKVVIEALENFKDQNIVYCICGKGNELKQLEAMADKYGIRDMVKFLGFRSDVDDIYRCADIFVFPSYREGMSMALMESMACGLPVICSDIRGNNELIVNNKGGYCVGPDRVDEFASGIKKIAESAQLRKSCGEYNKRFIEKFSIDEVNEKMIQLYSELL